MYAVPNAQACLQVVVVVITLKTGSKLEPKGRCFVFKGSTCRIDLTILTVYSGWGKQWEEAAAK